MRAGRLFGQLPILVEQAGGGEIRNGCARFQLDDGILAPERRAVVAVVAAILDGQVGIQHHVLRRVERVRVDQGRKALIRQEGLRVGGDAFLGPLDAEFAVFKPTANGREGSSFNYDRDVGRQGAIRGGQRQFAAHNRFADGGVGGDPDRAVIEHPSTAALQVKSCLLLGA